MLRLSRTAPLVELADLRRMAVIAAPGVIASGEVDHLVPMVLTYLGFAAVIAAGVYLKYRRFRYAIDGDSLVVQGGLLFRWRRVVPFARVQSVDVVRKVRHRLFGVVELRVEAIGGRSTEAVFPALAPGEAERIRLTVLRGSREAPTDEEIHGDRSGRAWWDDAPVTERPSGPPLAAMSLRDLLLYGVTGGRVAVLALFLVQGLELLPVDSIADAARGAPIGVVAASVAVVVLVSVLISLAMTVLAFWDFTLWREGDRLVTSRGLFEQRRSVVPLGRVQAVRLEENLLRRVLGYATLNVLVAGQAGGDANERQERSVLLPIATRPEAVRLAGQVLGADVGADLDRLERMPARGIARYVLRAALVVVPAAAAAAWWAGPAGWSVLGLLLAAAALSTVAWRVRGVALAPDHLLVRSGVFTYETSVVPYANIQHLSLSRGPTHHLLRLSSLRCGLVKGSAQASNLDRERAWEIYDEVGARVLRTHWVAAH
ncbi:MAG TPA: PH domain-containing protein [Actinomycetota bacterium]|nr:PH domain-containing protein [Actinomycetota bacterium]